MVIKNEATYEKIGSSNTPVAGMTAERRLTIRSIVQSPPCLIFPEGNEERDASTLSTPDGKLNRNSGSFPWGGDRGKF